MRGLRYGILRLLSEARCVDDGLESCLIFGVLRILQVCCRGPYVFGARDRILAFSFISEGDTGLCFVLEGSPGNCMWRPSLTGILLELSPYSLLGSNRPRRMGRRGESWILCVRVATWCLQVEFKITFSSNLHSECRRDNEWT